MRNALRIRMTASLLAASLVAAVVALSSCAVPPRPAATPAPATVEAQKAQIAAEVMQAERNLNTATDMKGDYETALKYISEDFIGIDQHGVSDRDASLSWVKDGFYKGESTDYDEVKIRVYGDTAVMTARIHFKGIWQGQPLDVRTRVTSVWVKRDGRWQVVSSQSVELPADTTDAAAAEVQREQISREILQAEGRLNKAADMEHDVATVAKYLSDDYVGVSSDGTAINKTQLLNDVKAGKYKGETASWDNATVRSYGDTAIVTFVLKFKGIYEGKPITGQQHYTNVWAKQNGQWQMVSSLYTHPEL